MYLAPLDLAVIAIYFAAMAGMGFFFAKGSATADGYFRAGRRIPWFVATMSLYVTMFSSITFLSVPAASYAGDCRLLCLSFGILLVAPLVVRFYLPYFRRLDMTSAYEYLERRFNLACRLFASAAFILFMVARSAIVIYLPALAVSSVAGVGLDSAIIAVAAVTTLYCTVGGIEAVIWSDFVQALVLIASTALILALLVMGADGGAAGFIRAGADAGKFRVFDFALDWTKPCFWVILVGGIVANLASYTSDQSVVQRYMTVKDEKGAAKSILLNAVVAALNNVVFFALGVALWAFYQTRPDALPADVKADAVLPVFIVRELPSGVSGLVIAAIAAATMSTLSSNLNAAASAVASDFHKRLFGGRRELVCGKVATVAVGALGGGGALALAHADVASAYDQFLRFLGVLTGGLGCLFFMGVFMRFVDGAAAVAGLVANYAVSFGLDLAPWTAKPHMLLHGALGMAAGLAVAALVGRVAPTRRSRAGLAMGTRHPASSNEPGNEARCLVPIPLRPLK